MEVEGAGAGVDGGGGDGELGTAGDADDIGDGDVGAEEFGEGGGVVLFRSGRRIGGEGGGGGGGEAGEDDFGGTAEGPAAAEVEVAGGVDVGEAQAAEDGDSV